MREKLRRLGVHKGAAHLKSSGGSAPAPAQPQSAPPQPTAAPPFEPMRTPFGDAVLRRARYSLDHAHGDRPLAQALAGLPSAVGGITPAGGGAFDLRDALFLDTETTGLAGGAGTLAFLVGVGYFDGDGPIPGSFVVDQYFLSDPAREAAMLAHLDGLLASRSHLVTFNGRAFDVPLLQMRYTQSRIAPSFDDLRHLDLLVPARRVWRGALSSCSLGSLEFHLLGVHRDQLDIPGFLIPQIYREYLQTGDLRDIERVMYHNLLDVLSMVTLAARLREVFTHPASATEHLALARQHEANGEFDAAVAAYRTASAGADAAHRPAGARATQRLATMLKRLKRNEEAIEYWEVLADAGDIQALLELSKHYEWTAGDPALALDLAARAYVAAATAPERDAIAHRLRRLRRKLEAARAPDPAPPAASSRR